MWRPRTVSAVGIVVQHDEATLPTTGATRALSLSAAARYLLEESRMVLPGIQALFGFQLIAVFSATFGERLSAGEQQLHLAATFLIAVAEAIMMAPAAYHRQAGPREVTEKIGRA